MTLAGSQSAVLQAIISDRGSSSRVQQRRSQYLTEQNWQNINNINPSALVLLIDPTGNCFAVNKYAMPWLGFTDDDILKCSIENLLHPDDRDAVLLEFWKAIFHVNSGLSEFNVSFRCVSNHSRYVWLDANGVMRATDPNKAFIILVCQLASNKPLPAGLALEPSQFQLGYVPGVEDPCDQAFRARLTVDGFFKMVSPLCRSIMGFGPLELLGTSMYEYIEPEQLSQFGSDFYGAAYCVSPNVGAPTKRSVTLFSRLRTKMPKLRLGVD